MAFQNLRSNNTIYILHKNENPTLDIGKVLNVTPPMPKYGTLFTDMVVDIAVSVGEDHLNFLKVPAILEITDVGNDIVISCNKSAINDEVSALKLKSEDIINNIDYHNNIIKGCNEILKVLNPEIAEKEQRELETLQIKDEISSLRDMISLLISLYKN